MKSVTFYVVCVIGIEINVGILAIGRSIVQQQITWLRLHIHTNCWVFWMRIFFLDIRDLTELSGNFRYLPNVEQNRLAALTF